MGHMVEIFWNSTCNMFRARGPCFKRTMIFLLEHFRVSRNDDLPSGAFPKHLLWALYFLRCYDEEGKEPSVGINT
jgi:hypothetical protein